MSLYLDQRKHHRISTMYLQLQQNGGKVLKIQLYIVSTHYFFFFFTFLRFCLTLNNISVNHSGFQISAFFCRSDQTRDMNLL